jgi:hypothetical protein
MPARLVSPPLPGPQVPGLTCAAPALFDPPEDVLCVVGPGRATAMCTRGEHTTELAVTHDLDLARTVARQLMTRLEVGTARLDAGDRAPHPATAAAR